MESFHWALKYAGHPFHFDFTIRAAAAHKDSKVITLWSTLTAAWLLSCLRPLLHAFAIETLYSKPFKSVFYFLFFALPVCLSARLSLQSSRRFDGDLSGRLGSASYINCQHWGLPDQSEACLSSWSALNVFASAEGSAGYFVTQNKRNSFSRGQIKDYVCFTISILLL